MTDGTQTALRVGSAMLLYALMSLGAHAQGFFADVTNVNIDGAGTLAVVAPGANYQVVADYQVWNSEGCPGCIAQLIIGTDDGTKDCIYNGVPGVEPGVSANGAVSLVAPTEPGIYDVRFDFDLQFNCPDAVANWPTGSGTNVIGQIVVATGGFFAQVTNTTINGSGTSALVAPGAQFEVNTDYLLWNSNGCPGCIAQLIVGTDGGSKDCIYNGIPGVAPGQSGNMTVALTAPQEQGVYQLRYDFDLQFSCGDAINNWPTGSGANVIGEIIVGGGAFFAQVTNPNIEESGSSAVVAPGAGILVEADYHVWNSDGCPSCISQIVVGTDDGGKDCIFNGIPGVAPGQNGTGLLAISAPMQPGIHPLRYDFDLQFSCGDAINNWPTGSAANVLGDLIVAATKRDMNGDGTADVLWRNSTSGLNWLFQMNAAGVLASGPINRVSDQNWKIVGNGDYNGDGKADMFWRNVATGQNWLHQMNGAAVLQSGPVVTVADQNWQVVGNGDVNGDGTSDVLWYNIGTGQTWLFQMNGASVIQSGQVNRVADLSWRVVGSGDFNGDGKGDMLWRNLSNGQNWMHLLDGQSVIDTGPVNTVADLSWQVAGIGDANGDGTADILWYNSGSGQTWLFQMNGRAVTSSGPVNRVADLNWRVVGYTDYNGDRKADILWRNLSTGQNWLHRLDVANILQSGPINSVADLSWTVINTN